MNFRKTLKDLAWIKFKSNNLLISFIMLCSFSSVQSIIIFKPLLPILNIPEKKRTIQSYPTANYVHGFGISRYSDFDPDRAYSEAYHKALQDLNSNLMTSVILEFYGTQTLQPRLYAEFAIRDEIDIQQTVRKDSMRIGDWAVFIVGHKNRIGKLSPDLMDHPAVLNDFDTSLSPVQAGNFWLASGSAPYSEYNPYRSFTLAKQNALQNLSLHIQTVVQGSQKALNENMQTITYQTSRNVFSDIYVMKREQSDGRIHLLIAVEEDNIFTWRD